MNWKRFFFTNFMVILILSSQSISTKAAFWELTGDTAVHDPSIIKEGDTWYTFSTGPGLQVLRSDNGSLESCSTNFFPSTSMVEQLCSQP